MRVPWATREFTVVDCYINEISFGKIGQVETAIVGNIDFLYSSIFFVAVKIQ